MSRLRPPHQTGFRPSQHAIDRYIERFGRGMTREVARKQLERIARVVQRRRNAPGGARVYGKGRIEMVVKDAVIMTVYQSGSRTLTAINQHWSEEATPIMGIGNAAYGTEHAQVEAAAAWAAPRIQPTRRYAGYARRMRSEITTTQRMPRRIPRRLGRHPRYTVEAAR